MRKNEWVKSSRCSVRDCVEVQHDPTGNGVFVRSSRTHRTVTFDAAEWRMFIEGVKNGEFDV